MKWTAAQIARVAAAAGFGPADTVTATAVALATSGGLDNYDHRYGYPGTGRQRGLWGIDTDRWPAYADRPLDVPAVNATTARELCVAHDGWSWSPTWFAGHWAAYVPHAGTERTRAYTGQPVVAPVTITDNARRQATTLAGIRNTTARAAQWSRKGGQ